MKKALITGITGQDGAYLSEYLLSLGYEVHGIKRRSSLFNTQRIDHIYQDPHESGRRLFLHYGDMSDSMNITRIIKEVEPDEVYNLAAMSHVKVSFESPEYTADVDAVGTLRVLEAIRLLGLQDKTRFYQASTSELYGLVQEMPQRESTPFYPRSPYACAKLYAYWITVNYREAYNLHASNGILFNHESPLRGETFVTRKITRTASRIALGLSKELFLGNLSAKRDWGHAKDYVRSMHLIVNKDKPSDYVVATGVTTEVREFARLTFKYMGINIEFEGEGIDEVGRISSIDTDVFEAIVGRPFIDIKKRIGDIVIRVDKAYFRPTEVDILLGDSSKAKRELGWEPEYSLQDIVEDMTSSDLKLMKQEDHLRKAGFDILNYFE